MEPYSVVGGVPARIIKEKKVVTYSKRSFPNLMMYKRLMEHSYKEIKSPFEKEMPNYGR